MCRFTFLCVSLPPSPLLNPNFSFSQEDSLFPKRSRLLHDSGLHTHYYTILGSFYCLVYKPGRSGFVLDSVRPDPIVRTLSVLSSDSGRLSIAHFSLSLLGRFHGLLLLNLFNSSIYQFTLHCPRTICYADPRTFPSTTIFSI